MKFEVSALVAGLAATVSAQTQHQTGPFSLLVKGVKSNSTINGYLENCHTGAGLSALCYAKGQPAADSNYYGFNYTGLSKAGYNNVGTLTYALPVTGDNGPETVSQGLGVVYQTTSNVAAPQFGVGGAPFDVGFDGENELFGYNYIDDSTFVPGKQPSVGDLVGRPFFHWAVCWQYFTGYYYQSLAWVQSGAPHNPTCEAVTVVQKKI
ncbi:hypothetical protein F4861DRAFT_351449 [Xylaria intraflava]|nr:hypothetical protein F4861DRAFT_351449 [Xylaria intraflava]